VGLALALAASGPSSLAAQCREPEGPAYDTRGRIVAFEPNGGELRIAHEAIPGYMRAMTMLFAPCPTVDVADLSVGDVVAFRFTRGPGGRFLILSLERVEPAASNGAISR
jgi:Cu/Ag efflux protein CusF